jgi:sulfhydrogenase subunit gamma (sulfur reductase)
MRTILNLQPANNRLYVPEPVKILKTKNFTAKEKFFEMEILSGKSLGHIPGQFIQLVLLGIGEAPISISSAPASHNRFDMCVRALGEVTNKLHALPDGTVIHYRGPFGHGFDEKIFAKMQNKHLLLIVGGLGLAPLRSLINKIVPERKNYKKITILYGSRTPDDRLYSDELATLSKLGENVELLETVDRPAEGWAHNVGVITTLIPKVDFKPEEALAFIVGPPIMYKFVLKTLLERKMPPANIYIDLERRMRCGVGKCGHCQMEDIYVCQEGPVFNYAEVMSNEEVF